MAVENRLIEMLPRRERIGLLSICKPVELVLSDVLFEVRDRTSHVYFPIDGFVSLLASVDVHSALEVGMVGREGMVGVEVLLGESWAPLRAVVQGEGTAWRAPIAPFRKTLIQYPALRFGLNRYVAVLMTQLASSSACVRYHLVGARLARWLLMTQDRSHADHFYITQEFVAFMLGVRRVSVTSAAGVLQRDGLVEYSRGEMRVLDRKGLEAAACSCYATDQSAYADMLA